MSNNSEYTREYIDNVEQYFNEVDRLIVTPAICKTLSYQQVTEFYAKHSMADTFKEYLLDNVQRAGTDWDEIEEQVEEYKEVKKALLKLKVQLDTFYHCVEEESQEQWVKYVDMLEELAEGEIPEELKDKPKKKSNK